MGNHYPIIVEQDIDGVFIVGCPIFKGCRSYGYTIDEALDNIKEAIELCSEEENDNHLPINTFVGIRDIEVALA
ncbi:MAG: type II toxin-antitoxin system HicB family antitoxin [candidate division Zixibacteria bacterium]|nr:type II toxin-antitoxin system HicB family antitoxin [candidate division Zixibacteria bacterium]